MIIILASSVTVWALRSYVLVQSVTFPSSYQEHAFVQLTGDIIRLDQTKYHYVSRGPEWGVIVHRDVPSYVEIKHVETTPGLWSVDDTVDFTGDQESKFGFHIYEADERAWMRFRFGEYSQEDLDEGIIWAARLIGLRKYQLEGYGCWEGESMPYGTITVDNEPFKISLMIWTEVTEGEWKGGSMITYKEVWTGRLSFTVTISPLEEG